MDEFIIPRQYNKLELKFFYFILSKLNDESPDKVIITSLELYNICDKHRLSVLDVFFKLKSKDAAVVVVDGMKRFVNMFESFVQHVGYWEINFNTQFVDALLELKKVSSEKVIVMFGLDSIYAVKLYNALSEVGKTYLEKSEIRALFGQSEGVEWSRIEKKFLEPAIKEINKISDIHITKMSVVPQGKRYPLGYMFFVKLRVNNKVAIQK